LPLTVLDGSTFCVCDERGDVDGLATASGFFASDTRFLSRSVLTLGGARLDPLSHDHSTPYLASFVLRKPLAGGLQPNELVIERERFVGDCMEERIAIVNHSQRRVDVELGLELAADFADIFVVKDLEPGFGRPVDVTLPPARPPERADNGTLVFSDGAFSGQTVVHLSESFDESDGVARFALSLEPGACWRLVVGVQAELAGVAPLPAASFARELDEERRRAEQSMTEWQRAAPVLSARWDDLVHTWNRSLADLASLRMRVPEVADGHLLAAGTPWFMTVFGRDTLISSLQTLLLGPELAAGTLRVLAATQATSDDPERDDPKPPHPSASLLEPEPRGEHDREKADRRCDQPVAMFVQDAAHPFGRGKREHVPAVGGRPVRHRQARVGAGDQAAREDEQHRAAGDKCGELVQHLAGQGCGRGRGYGRPACLSASVSSSRQPKA